MLNLTVNDVKAMRKAFNTAIKDQWGDEDKEKFSINGREFKVHCGLGNSEHRVWITDTADDLDVCHVSSIMSWDTVFHMLVVAMNDKVTTY